MQVENMLSPRTGNAVANQFKIIADDGVYFQSYDSVIVFKPYNGKVQLDEKYWNYSRTTGKYRNEFLREGVGETRRKINDGTYELVNLN